MAGQGGGHDLGWRLVKNEDSDRALRVAAISLGPDERVRYVTRALDGCGAWIALTGRAANWMTAPTCSPRDCLPTEEALATLNEGEWFRVIAGKAKRAKRAYPMLLIQVCEAHEKGGRPLGDEVNEMMSVWRREALKLATAAHHSRRRATDHRKHYFRNVAAQMVQQAGLIGAIRN